MANKRGQKRTLTEAEKAARMSEMRTQGIEGMRLPRINLALSPENYDFVKVLASASGNTMTRLVNLIIAAYRNEHPGLEEQSRAVIETINSGVFAPLKNGTKEE